MLCKFTIHVVVMSLDLYQRTETLLNDLRIRDAQDLYQLQMKLRKLVDNVLRLIKVLAPVVYINTLRLLKFAKGLQIQYDFLT